MSGEGESITFTFPAGPLGVVLNTEAGRSFIRSLVAEGAAATLGVREGDHLLAVAGAPVAGLSHDEVLNLIRAAARPMALVFQRGGGSSGGSSSGSSSGGGAGGDAAAAMKKAGTFMKGLLGAGVQAIAGVEKLVGGAVDTTTMRATVRFMGP